MFSVFTGLLLTGAFSILVWLLLAVHHHSSDFGSGGNDGKFFNNPIKHPLRPTLRTPPPQPRQIPTVPIQIKSGDKEEGNAPKPPDDDQKDLLPANHNAEGSASASSIVDGPAIDRRGSKRGVLMCNGVRIDSEVIYWKIVPGDNEFESPITPHHGLHHDRYLSFEYDQGGWNNVRMGMESLIVVAHAMGRTLVVPPPQHLYLLGKVHKDVHDRKEHDEMGFEDFFSIDLLRSHKGFHVLHMEEFLAKEGVTGGLHGKLPPKNSTTVWGEALWKYLWDVADAKPEWMGRFLAFPKTAGDFNMTTSLTDPATAKRMKVRSLSFFFFRFADLNRAT